MIFRQRGSEFPSRAAFQRYKQHYKGLSGHLTFFGVASWGVSLTSDFGLSLTGDFGLSITSDFGLSLTGDFGLSYSLKM